MAVATLPGERASFGMVILLAGIYQLKQVRPQVFVSMLSKSTGLNYAWVSKNLAFFKQLGLITTNKKGRRVLLSLTTDGFEVAKSSFSVLEAFNGRRTGVVVVKRNSQVSEAGFRQ